MKRDEKGRFMKDEDDIKGYKFSLTFPSVTTLILDIYRSGYSSLGYYFGNMQRSQKNFRFVR